jgi:hypothetical protein
MTFIDFAFKKLCMAAGFCLCMQMTQAQTDVDAIMLHKNVLCTGLMYSHSSWDKYWEGTYKRNNQNLGTVTTQMYGVMGSYGVTNKLNFLFNLPYVQTKSSAGTLKGMKGLQDLSLMLKWMPYLTHVGKKGIISAYAIGGVSFPTSNYVADFLPLSIGMRSKTAALRLMADYQLGHFFATASGVYMLRSNISIDRNSYYTTEMHYTNKVDMPDAAGYNVRAGFRSNTWVAEAVVENMTTLGGFDIRKNDMPFPSNEMNATQAGVNLKYSLHAVPGLEVTGGYKYTVHGRNMGQATTIYGGIFYILSFSGRNKTDNNIKTN